MTATEQPLVRVRDLRVEFRTRRGTVHAVNGIDLDVSQGEAVGIVGESGSGKSVAVMTVAGLGDAEARVVEGSVEVAGIDVLKANKRTLRRFHGRTLGIVFQNPLTSLDPVYTVGDQVTEVLRLHPAGKTPNGLRALFAEIARSMNADGKRAYWRELGAQLLRHVGLPDPLRAAESYSYQLSGGMRQRSMIASALALEPRLIIADEPTTALDVTIQAQVLALIDGLRAMSGTSLILVSHDLSVVSQHCDVVIVMYAGRVVERASSENLFREARHPYTRGLLEAIPQFEGPRRPLVGIPGAPPDNTREVEGCPFAPRCTRVVDRCRVEFPEETQVSDGHTVWCHNPW